MILAGIFVVSLVVIYVAGRVFAGKDVVTLLLEAERGLGRPALTAQLMLLPMVGDQGLVDLMLGCLVLRGAAGRTPRRFHILDATYERIGAAPRVAHEPALTVVPVAHAERAPVPYLRLVK